MTRLEWVLLGLAVVVIALATGCATPETIKVPEIVYLDRPVPCLSPADVPQRPALVSPAELLAMDTYQATHALWASYVRAVAYIGELEAVAEGCAKLPRPDP